MNAATQTRPAAVSALMIHNLLRTLEDLVTSYNKHPGSCAARRISSVRMELQELRQTLAAK